jgi:hypothetical protein
MDNYRYHSGTTNVLVRAWLLDALRHGQHVTMSIATNILFRDGTSSVLPDLQDKNDQLVIESIALFRARMAGDVVVNKPRRRTY